MMCGDYPALTLDLCPEFDVLISTLQLHVYMSCRPFLFNVLYPMSGCGREGVEMSFLLWRNSRSE